MKRFLLASLLSSAATLPAVAALPEGHPAPDFQTQAFLAGKSFSVIIQPPTPKTHKVS